MREASRLFLRAAFRFLRGAASEAVGAWTFLQGTSHTERPRSGVQAPSARMLAGRTWRLESTWLISRCLAAPRVSHRPSVVSQQGDTIRLHLSGPGLGENIYRAELVIDEIWLLWELLATLENLQERLTVVVFRLSLCNVPAHNANSRESLHRGTRLNFFVLFYEPSSNPRKAT
jgi:hypothetical protein